MSSHNPNHDQPLEPTDSAEARMRLALGLGTRPANSGQPSGPSSPPPTSHDSTRQRRRFAQDGDVPVVMLHRGRDGDSVGENKIAALTADLREERAARVKADRALEEANGLISSLKTKLKHAEMALEEKHLAEGESRAHWDALLATEREARQQAEAKAAEAALALSLLERKTETAAKAALVQSAAVEPAVDSPSPDLFAGLEGAPASVPKRRLSKKASALPQPKPVEAAPEPAAPAQADVDEDKPIEWWLPSFRAARKTPNRRKRVAS